MLPVLWIGVAILSSTATALLSRAILKNDFSALSFSVLVNLIAALFFLPVAVSKFHVLPHSSFAWWFLFFACGVWALTTFSSSVSHKRADATLRAPLGQSRLLWVVLMGVLILHETITGYRAIGILIIFFGVLLLVWHPERKLGSLGDPGVRDVLVYSFLAAFAAVIDKMVLRYFSAEFYGFAAFMIPGIILLWFGVKKKEDLIAMWQHNAPTIVLISFLVAASYYGMLKAYVLFDISFVYPLFQLSVLMTALGGILFLKEREHLWQKIFAAIFVIVGSVLLKIG